MALIVDALAPTFGGTKNQVGALKVVAYGAIAVYVAGLLKLLPALGLLGILAACYSIYLMYLGLPVVMKCPRDKAAGYTAVVVIVYIVEMMVAGSVTAMFGGLGGLGAPGGRYGHAGGTFSVKTANGALTGAGGPPIPPADLKARLPETLGALKRESFETNGGAAAGIAGSVAKATYTGGENQRAELSITNLGGLGGLASVATWANVTVDRETPDDIEKTYKDGGRTIHEQYRKDGSHSEVTVILKNGVIVDTTGDHIDGATLKSMATAVDLDAIEAMKRPAKT
jgi:hypothetical protein